MRSTADDASGVSAAVAVVCVAAISAAVWLGTPGRLVAPLCAVVALCVALSCSDEVLDPQGSEHVGCGEGLVWYLEDAFSLRCRCQLDAYDPACALPRHARVVAVCLQCVDHVVTRHSARPYYHS